MDYIVNKLKDIGLIQNDDVEGYILMKDEKENKNLVMVRTNEKCWKTEWISNNTAIKTPNISLGSVMNSN